jgi:cytochrome c oxidase cbb3-type subunit 2
MLKSTERNAGSFFIIATVFFFIGGILTTALPAVIETNWNKPTAGMKPYTESEARGKAIYVREGCWYCHTQQIRTLESDVKRYGWRGVDAPISTPSEFTRDAPHMFGTKRTGPDLARVGGKYDKSWHRTHFKNPRDLVPGSIMPMFPWILTGNNGQDFEDLVAYIQSMGRTVPWRPNNDYER